MARCYERSGRACGGTPGWPGPGKGRHRAGRRAAPIALRFPDGILARARFRPVIIARASSAGTRKAACKAHLRGLDRARLPAPGPGKIRFCNHHRSIIYRLEPTDPEIGVQRTVRARGWGGGRARRGRRRCKIRGAPERGLQEDAPRPKLSRPSRHRTRWR